MRLLAAVRALLLVALALAARAGDWPEWRGRGRLGVWNEDGLLETFPPEGLPVLWRAPVRGGYAGPAVAGGRVFVTDYTPALAKSAAGVERVLALDERTGRTLWTREWKADYRGLDYATGPRATPTVDGERVYVLGAMGALVCLSARDGEVIWKKDFVRDFGAVIPAWGTANAPLVDGERLIAVAGGRPDAKVMAFDKRSGRELWRSLSGLESEPGYSQPVIISSGGRRQLILWDAGAVRALNPETGRVYWEHPFRITMNTPIATPVERDGWLLVSGFFNGARMLRVDGAEARLAWAVEGEGEMRSQGLHALLATPVIDGDYLYGICSYGQLRCLRLSTGARVWESQQATREKARNASAHIVRNRDRYFILNDRGELISARLSPGGYRETGRSRIIRPTSPAGGRRELGAVAWSHPAFANRHVVARNDEEVIRVSLEAAHGTADTQRN